MVSAWPCVHFLPPAHSQLLWIRVPFKHKVRSKRGEREGIEWGRREWEREGEGEEKVNTVEFLQIKAPKWGSCHTRLIS